MLFYGVVLITLSILHLEMQANTLAFGGACNIDAKQQLLAKHSAMWLVSPAKGDLHRRVAEDLHSRN